MVRTRTRVLAGIATAALTASGALVLTAGPASAGHPGSDHPGCFLLHLEIEDATPADIFDFCL